MRYLKCTNCGFANEVKTPYMVFCGKCNKKMENNFPDWQVRYPNKSFADFMSTECIDELDNAAIGKAKKPKSRTLPIILIILALIIMAVGAVAYYKQDKIGTFANEYVWQLAMVKAANKLNKTCPLMVDSITRLDNAVAVPYPSNIFQYNYTLLKVPQENVSYEEIKAGLEPVIVNYVRTSPDMKHMRDHNVTVKYAYKDVEGVHLFTIEVKPEQYLINE